MGRIHPPKLTRGGGRRGADHPLTGGACKWRLVLPRVGNPAESSRMFVTCKRQPHG